MNVNALVYVLPSNKKFRKGLQGFMEPVRSEGIDVLELSSPEIEKPLIIDKKQADSFLLGPSQPQHPGSTTREMFMQPTTVVLEGDYVWRFSEGKDQFAAKVEGTDFIARIDDGEIRFGKNDILRVGLREDQKSTLRNG